MPPSLPLIMKLSVLNEKRRRKEEDELFKYYMSNLVTLWGGERSYLECLKDLEHSKKTEDQKEKEIENAYSVANSTLAALEQSRKEENGGRK